MREKGRGEEWGRGPGRGGKRRKKGRKILFLHFIFVDMARCHGDPGYEGRIYWVLFRKLSVCIGYAYDFNYHPVNIA